MRDIRRLDAYDDLVRSLAEAPHPSTKSSIFATFRELVCFAAVLGYENELKVSLTGPSSPLVDGRIFSNSEQAVDILYLVGLAALRDQDILLDDKDQEEKLITTFEEYANGGFKLLNEWRKQTPEDAYGDKAILSALRAHKFLEGPESVEHALDNVVF